MELLRFIEELREPEDFFGEVPNEKPQKEMIDLTVQLINQKSADFNPDNYKDRYQEALKALIQQKMKGKKVVAPDDESRSAGANVVDLMEALKRSVDQKSANCSSRCLT